MQRSRLMSEDRMDRDIETTKQAGSTGPVTSDAYLELEPGSVLLEKYKVINLLGRGGMGSVYRVEHLHLQKQYALKFLHKHQANDAAWRRFETEARAANKLDHPNLVKVHDSGLLEDGQPYFIMDLVEGESLSEMLKNIGRLPLEKALKIFIQVGFALSYAHSNGVIHRDVKPSNIMIASTNTEDAQGVLVKVVDFGIAKLTRQDEFNQQTLTKTGEIFGSPLYMSPEQCLGGTIDKRCDLYSLGCVFFEALTGAPPLVGDNALATMMKHQSETPVSLKEASMGIEFPAKMEAIVAQLLQKDPELRYQSAQHLTADLIGLDSGQVSMFEPLRLKPQPSMSRNTHNPYVLLFYAACWFFGGTVVGWIFPHPPATKESALKLAATKEDWVDVWNPTSEQSRAVEIAKTEAEKNMLELEKQPGYFSEPGSKAGERIFNFPHYEIGNLIYSKRHRPPAKEKQIFQNFEGLTFAPSEEFQKHPKLFKKFRSDDLVGLDLQSNAHILNLNEKDMSSANTALYGISHLTRLQMVDLGDTIITPGGLAQLDKLPNLKRLLLTRINLPGTDIAKLRCLNKLSHLKMVNLKDIKPVIQKLHTSKNIFSLVLTGCDVDISDLKMLANMKELRILEIADNEQLNDDAMAFLPPQIADLDIRKCPVTSKCAKHLLRLRNLRTLRLDSKGWTDAEITALKKRVTNTTFFDGGIQR